MKKLLHFILPFFVFSTGFSQTQLYINNDIKVSPGTILYSTGSDLIIHSNANIINDGDWTVNNTNTSLSAGSSTTGTGTMHFIGQSTQIIDGNGNSIDCNVHLDNTSNLVLNTLSTGTPSSDVDLYLGGLMTFQNGYIVTGSDKIVFKSGSSYTGASDASHVNGWCQKAGLTAFVFPVGNGTKLRTAAISAPSQVTDNFLCKYFKNSPHSFYNTNLRDTTLKSVSTNEYWRIERVFGNAAVDVTLSWHDSFSGIIGSMPNLKVARWDGAQWRDHGNGGTTGNAANGTVKSVAAVTSFSPFTLGTSSTLNILPVELLEFTAVKKDRTSYLQWTTASEKNSDYFIVERSDNRLDWTEIGKRDAAGNSNTIQKYALTDFNPVTGINYYRLKQVDRDNKYAYSPIRSVVFSPEIILSMFPNPASDEVTITSNLNNQTYDIFDVLGQVVLKGELKPISTTINISQLAAGSYIVKLYPSNQNLILEKQ